MAQHRPIETRIAEAQAQILALQAKANKQVINNDPAVQAVDAEIANLNNTNAKWKRWSFEAEQKVENFLARAETWRVRGAKAETAMEDYREQMDALRQKRSDAVNAATESLMG
jgi:hypothetical protein